MNVNMLMEKDSHRIVMIKTDENGCECETKEDITAEVLELAFQYLKKTHESLGGESKGIACVFDEDGMLKFAAPGTKLVWKDTEKEKAYVEPVKISLLSDCDKNRDKQKR